MTGGNSPEDRVEELLSAPDVTAKSETERQKYSLRKAREKAEQEQLRAAKRDEVPTVEDLLADIVRVAEDEETNPFHKFKSISRRRYVLYGWYPIEFVDREFGQFEHAKQVAGLSDQPGTRMWRANRAKESRRAHAERYLERYVHPYAAREEDYRLDCGSYDLLSISDTHSQFLCPFTWLAFLSAIRDLKPDGVLWNGDTLEGSEISRHPKIPGWTVPFQSELDFHWEMGRQVREDAGHQGDFFISGGNHGVDRVASYMTQVAPALANLRSLRIDRLLGLDDFDIRLFQGGTIASPEGTEDARHGFLMFGHYRIHHGTLLGQHPAASELRAAGRSGQSGHVHRAGLAYGTTERDEALCWMSTPCGCRHEAARSYIKGNTGWQRGFGWARLWADGTVEQHPVVVQVGQDGQERISVEGYTYSRPGDLEDPEPRGVWLKDLRLR